MERGFLRDIPTNDADGSDAVEPLPPKLAVSMFCVSGNNFFEAFTKTLREERRYAQVCCLFCWNSRDTVNVRDSGHFACGGEGGRWG